jgi:hypothetical protein
MSTIRRGCDLLPVYAACADGVPANCENGLPKELRDWIGIQMYACELLVGFLYGVYYMWMNILVALSERASQVLRGPERKGMSGR